MDKQEEINRLEELIIQTISLKAEAEDGSYAPHYGRAVVNFQMRYIELTGKGYIVKEKNEKEKRKL